MTKFDRYISDARARFTAFVMLVVMGFVLCLLIWESIKLGRVLFGLDFIAFWSAAKLAVTVDPSAPFNLQTYHEMVQTVHPYDEYLFWHYPPTFLAMLWPFGYLPYAVGLFIFLSLSVVAWVILMRWVWPKSDWIQVLPVWAAPAAALNFFQAQNGTFTALFLVGFMLAMKAKRPVLAGLLISGLLIKPQFGLFIPFMLIALREWRVFGWATFFCCVFLALSTALVGIGYWVSFFENSSTIKLLLTEADLLRQQISGFAFFRRFGMGLTPSFILHFTAAALALIVMIKAFQTENWNLRIASFVIATVMLSPYAHLYDLAASCVAMGLLCREVDRFQHPYGRVTLAIFWLGPFIHSVFYDVHILVVFPILLSMLWLIWGLCVKAQEV